MAMGALSTPRSSVELAQTDDPIVHTGLVAHSSGGNVHRFRTVMLVDLCGQRTDDLVGSFRTQRHPDLDRDGDRAIALKTVNDDRIDTHHALLTRKGVAPGGDTTPR